jgi:hypothetical protein
MKYAELVSMPAVAQERCCVRKYGGARRKILLCQDVSSGVDPKRDTLQLEAGSPRNSGKGANGGGPRQR